MLATVYSPPRLTTDRHSSPPAMHLPFLQSTNDPSHASHATYYPPTTVQLPSCSIELVAATLNVDTHAQTLLNRLACLL